MSVYFSFLVSFPHQILRLSFFSVLSSRRRSGLCWFLGGQPVAAEHKSQHLLDAAVRCYAEPPPGCNNVCRQQRCYLLVPRFLSPTFSELLDESARPPTGGCFSEEKLSFGITESKKKKKNPLLIQFFIKVDFFSGAEGGITWLRRNHCHLSHIHGSHSQLFERRFV